MDMPIKGLWKTQATAIVANDSVQPTTNANSSVAMFANWDKNMPTSGTIASISIIGEKSRKNPRMQSTTPANRRRLTLHPILSSCYLK